MFNGVLSNDTCIVNLTKENLKVRCGKHGSRYAVLPAQNVSGIYEPVHKLPVVEYMYLRPSTIGITTDTMESPEDEIVECNQICNGEVKPSRILYLPEKKCGVIYVVDIEVAFAAKTLYPDRDDIYTVMPRIIDNIKDDHHHDRYSATEKLLYGAICRLADI